MTKAWDAGKPMDIIYLDYEKAFDLVLEHFGLRGGLLHWFEEFRTERSFNVRIKNWL